MQTLATKEEILKQVDQKRYVWFRQDGYFQGIFEPGVFINRQTAKSITRDGYNKQKLYAQKYQSIWRYVLSEDEILRGLVQIPEETNDGDGREARTTILFTPYNLYVSLIGIYSSYDETAWERVFVSEPYQHCFTRYQRKV